MELIRELALVFVGASIVGLVFRKLGQPLILAYIVAGIILGKSGLELLSSNQSSSMLSELGVSLLLFIVGMELSSERIREFGVSSFLLGLGQLAITGVLALIASKIIGLGWLSALYISLALTFSSTVIGIKILTDKRSLDSVHGRMIVGVLLVQDIFAIASLVYLHEHITTSESLNLISIFLLAIKALALIGGVLLFARFVLSELVESLAKNPELLYVSALGWAFLVGILASSLGFSPAIGMFIAGMAIADFLYATEALARISTVRNFFLTIFFVLLGSSIVLPTSKQFLTIVIPLLLFILVLRALIILGLMAAQGYRSRTNFLTAIYLSQLSEFSIVLVGVGQANGAVSDTTASLFIFSAILTMAVSVVLIENSELIYKKFRKFWRLFERQQKFQKDFHRLPKNLKSHVVLFGADRIGRPVLEQLEKLGHKILVVDFDPVVIARLQAEGITAIYGDMGDPDLISRLGLSRAKMVISTTHDFLDNLMVVKRANEISRKSYVYVTAETASQAIALYEAGADYVILPAHLSGDYLAEMIGEIKESQPKTTARRIAKIKAQHLKQLRTLEVEGDSLSRA